MHKAKHHLLKIVPALSGIALLFVLAGSAYMLLRSPDENTDAETEKNVATSDEEQEAKESEKAHITLSSNSEDNNSWEYDIIDESVAKFVSTSTIDIDKDLNEGELKNKFTFEGIKEGETRVTFTYTNGDNTAESADYIIYVDEDLNARAEKVEDTENTPEE